MSSIVNVVSGRREVNRGRHCRDEEEIRSAWSRSPGPPLIIPRHRVGEGGDGPISVTIFLPHRSRDSPRPFTGRLRGYRNHLTTSSRLGAFASFASLRLASSRFALAPLFLYPAIIALFWIAPVISPYDRWVVNVSRHEVCGIRSPRHTVNVVKIRSLIDNLIADSSDSGYSGSVLSVQKSWPR